MTDKKLPHNHGGNGQHALEHMPDIADSATVAEMFKQVSDGSRLRIFLFLCHCEECVSNIAAAVDMSDPAVSHHLRLMREGGLITSRREGKEVYYKLADNRLARLLHHACDEMLEITCPICEKES